MRDKHTPGKWEQRGRDVFLAGETVLSVASANPIRPEATANARLIAAAPQMLEALQELMAAHGEQLHDAFAKANAAIAAATGGADAS